MYKMQTEAVYVWVLSIQYETNHMAKIQWKLSYMKQVFRTTKFTLVADTHNSATR